MKSFRKKQDFAQHLFRATGWVLLFIYMLLPFGKPVTEILHTLSHISVTNAAPDAHTHHAHAKYTAHRHSHPHQHADNTIQVDHVHKVLDWINSFINVATDTDETEYMVQKSIDKHVKVDKPLFRLPHYYAVQTTFSFSSDRVLDKHTYANILPPDVAG